MHYEVYLDVYKLWTLLWYAYLALNARNGMAINQWETAVFGAFDIYKESVVGEMLLNLVIHD